MKINRVKPYILNNIPIRLLLLTTIVLTLWGMSVPALSAEHKYVLDRENLTGNAGAYTDVIKLFNDIKDLRGTVTIEVAPSVYWLDDPDDPEIRTPKRGEGTPFAVEINCDTLNITGLSENPEDVVFAVNRGQTQGAVGNYTMFKFRGKQLNTENITYGNYCNLDLEYPRDPSQNRKRRKDAIVQAQIGICSGTEKLVAKNCRFLSRLNLCPFIGAHRTLYDNCYFECTDDALSGSAIYHKCGFSFFSSKPFYSTDLTGAIFLDCDIHSKCDGNQYFTKVPGMVTAIDCRFTSDHPIDIQWTRDASDTRCFQQNITLNGQPIVIDDTRRELSTILDDSPLLDAYKFEYNDKSYYNFSNLLRGFDGWDPMDMDSITKEAEKEYGKRLRNLPVALRVRADKSPLEAIGDTAEIVSTPLLWGAFIAGEPKKTVYISDNHTTRYATETVTCREPSGLVGACTVTVMPNLREAPSFVESPNIIFDEKSKTYRVDYRLDGNGIDNSNIVWYRVYRTGKTDDDMSGMLIPLRHGKGSSGAVYSPQPADIDHELAATVAPAFEDSYTGKISYSITPIANNSDKESLKSESELHTDFSDVPIEKKRIQDKGLWIFDTYKPHDTAEVDWEAADEAGWEYGKGYDASTGIGLIQTVRGARLSYTPERDGCDEMRVRMTVEPAKSGGQGFGSATKQYMDVCVKFDPKTLTGYALRIERTADHDRAVVFSLIRYDNGETQEISEKIVSNCFRTPCTITVNATNDKLTAEASTEAGEAKKCCDEVQDSVRLTADIQPNDNAGFCIQHTGSTGPSSTLIREVELKWE